MNTPTFSVVIPLYNKADTIERTLRSVEAQIFRDFEVIVVDDGSTDDGVSKVSNFKNTFHLRTVCQKNAGVSAARNRGVGEAKGDYIAFLDADDVWHPEYLKELDRIIELHPDARFIGSSSAIICSDRVIRMPETGRIERISFYDEWPIYSAIHTSSFAVARTAFNRVGGFVEGHAYYEDAELYYKLAKFYPLYVIRRNLEYYYRDALIRACDKIPKTCLDCPHLQWAEQELSKGSDDSSLKRCVRVQLLRQLVRYARCGDREMILLIIEHYPSISKLLPIVFFKSRWVNTVGLPILLAISAWFLLKYRMRVREIRRKDVYFS